MRSNYLILLASVAAPILGNVISRDDSHDHSLRISKTATVTPPQFTYDELWDLSNKFWTSFLSPNNEAQAEMINSTMLSEDCQGRIDATRDFVGRELNTEYIYGLFANVVKRPNTFTLLGVPQNYTITQFSANQNIAVMTVLVEFYFAAVNASLPVEIGTWMTYNQNGEITQYDGTFLRHMEWQLQTMVALGMRAQNISSPAQFQALLLNAIAGSVCATHTQYCTGANQQYASSDQCMDVFTKGTIPFGSVWQMGMNTLLCRMVHMNMVPARPDVHCAHIGPSGGGYCADNRDYTTYLTEPFFSQPFIPSRNGL